MLKRILISIIITFSAVSSALACEVTDVLVGDVMNCVSGTANEISEDVKDKADDSAVMYANLIEHLIRVLSENYKSALKETASTLRGEEKYLFDLIIEMKENLINGRSTQNFLDEAKISISTVPLSKPIPLVAHYHAAPFFDEMGDDFVEMHISGINLQRYKPEVRSEDVYVFDIKTLTHGDMILELKLKDNVRDSNWMQNLKLDLIMPYKSGFSPFKKKSVASLHTRVIDPKRILIRAAYDRGYIEKVYEDVPRTKRKSQSRVGRSWSHNLNVTPPVGKFIDVDSIREISWWEHDECSNRYTNRFFTRKSELQILAHMRGREQGGFDRDCGASWVYEYRLFEKVDASKIEYTEWMPLSQHASIIDLPQEEKVELREIEVKIDDDEIYRVDSFVSQLPFFEMSENKSEKKAYLRIRD